MTPPATTLDIEIDAANERSLQDVRKKLLTSPGVTQIILKIRDREIAQVVTETLEVADERGRLRPPR